MIFEEARTGSPFYITLHRLSCTILSQVVRFGRFVTTYTLYTNTLTRIAFYDLRLLIRDKLRITLGAHDHDMKGPARFMSSSFTRRRIVIEFVTAHEWSGLHKATRDRYQGLMNGECLVASSLT